LETWQKVLIGCVIGVLMIFTAVVYISMKNIVEDKEDAIASLQSQIAVVSQRDDIAVIRVTADIKSGTLFDPALADTVTIPKSASSDGYVTDPNELKDAKWRISVTSGTLISKSMLAFEPVFPTDRTILLSLDSITPSTQIGDFIDVRMITPGGIDLVVIPKKRIVNLYDVGVEVVVSETELMIWESAIIEKAIQPGTLLYGSKLIDPTLQNKLYAMYVPNDDILTYMMLNKNMIYPYLQDDDVEGARAYIESVQPRNQYVDSLFTTVIQSIRDKESKITNAYNAIMSANKSARSAWIQYQQRQAQLEGREFSGVTAADTQVAAANVQGGAVAPSAGRAETITSDGTYYDANGVLRQPDGTPVIQASDIVAQPETESEEAASLDEYEETVEPEIPVLVE
jgi:hypothetical protein